MDQKRLIETILSDRECSISMAKIYASELNMINDELTDVLDYWVNNQQIMDKEFYGVTVQFVINKNSTDIYGALLILNILIMDPDLVTKYLKTNFIIK
jgi:hypothetical protein